MYISLDMLLVFLIPVVSFVSCGGDLKMQPYIIGGNYADIQKFPHVVFIVIDDCTCGGSILNQLLVLTAAHCLEQVKSNSEVTVFAGHHIVDKALYVINAQSYMIHKNYDPANARSDICMIKLAAALTLGKTTQRVIIKQSGYFTDIAQIAGWGSVDDESNEDERMKTVPQKMIPKLRCEEQYGKLNEGTFCATAPNNPQKNRPAHGDSGSALVINEVYQIGILSFRMQMDHSVIVYTNISYFYDWITSKSVKLYCSE